MTADEMTEVLADDVLCETATDLREQLRRSILRELRLREEIQSLTESTRTDAERHRAEQAESWRRITDLECDLADARIALEELHRELTDTRRLVVR